MIGGAVLGKVLGKWKLWLILTLAIALAGAIWQWRGEIQEAARQAVIGEQLREDLREASRELQRAREERDRVERIAEERADRLDRLRQRERDLEQSLRALEESDDEVADWAERRLPGGILDRLRGEPRADNDDAD